MNFGVLGGPADVINRSNFCIDRLWSLYHPPKTRYSDDVLKAELARNLEILLGSYSMRNIHQNPFVILIAGDFNFLDCSFMESDFGLEQTVNKPTHCNHVYIR
jgi:hypothetical protein